MSSPDSGKSQIQSMRHWIVEHKLRAVGSLWLSGIAGSIAYNWSQPGMKTSVRIIHARLHAQALTLAALAGAAVVEYYDHKTGAKSEREQVGYTFSVPWYASLPRLEARSYVEQYGSDDDVWIRKYMYRWENPLMGDMLSGDRCGHGSVHLGVLQEWLIFTGGIREIELLGTWALATPCYAIVTVATIFMFYIGLNYMATPPPSSLNSIYD
nr:hypoxia induced protein, domain-containing protein [Tanacetum cinerariifolium]